MKDFLRVTLYNYIFRIAYLAITFMAVPISLKYLGNQRYGIWQTMMSLIGFVSLTNFGIGNGLRNRVTEYFTNDDKIGLKKVISSAYISLTIISFVILVISIPLFWFFNYNWMYSNITISHSEIAIAFIIIIIGFSVNFVIGLVTSIVYGIHKSHLVTLSQLISSIISLLLTLCVINTVSRLYVMSLIYSISNILVNVILTIIVYKIDRCYIPSLKLFDKYESKKLYTLGMSFFLLQIVALFMNTSDSFIVAKLIGATDVTNYSIVNKVFNLIPTLFSIVLIQVWSQTAKEVTLNKYNNIKKMINKLLLLLIPIFIVLIFIVITFNFISLIWLRKIIDVSKLLLISSALYAFLTCINGIFVNIQNGLGIIKYQIISYTIAVIIQFPLAYFLVHNLNLGVGGVMLSKSIILFIPTIVNLIHVVLFINKRCRKEKK
ncbi:oligosaccharide flippase family protein [Clostridium perfringens]|uniref:oligosaccharide flippase family protein n=1 Tax=Clostridium perfringens TaxID=1502 RepID=UPI0018E4A1C9|nr:oligosaccharide flippase family protein [Clostridium perfringens]MBI6102240.1 oligosaccharide flippase family protein [Clostridium perfringens]